MKRSKDVQIITTKKAKTKIYPKRLILLMVKRWMKSKSKKEANEFLNEATVIYDEVFDL